MKIEFSRIVKKQKIYPRLDIELINKGACVTNSKLLAESMDGMRVVEGLMLVYREDFQLEVWAHVWNTRNREHYDITFQTFFEKEEGIQDVFYYPINEFSLAEYVKLTRQVPSVEMQEFEAKCNSNQEESDQILKGLIVNGHILMRK